MGNLIEYATILQSALDKQAVQQATTGWMEANAGQVKYTGGNEVKVPKMSVTGLGDYDRERGKYPQGGINLDYQSFTLTQDRGAQFYFDRHDVDESNYIVTATSVIGEFQRAHVIPEIDAYRYSAIAQKLIEAKTDKAYTPSDTTIIKEFLANVREMQNKTGVDTGNLVATMPYSVYAILESVAEAKKSITPQNFQQGGLSFEVKTINGVPIIPVVESRMKTKYIFKTGETDFGFTEAEGAKTINWIIMPRNVPIAISKTDNLKIFAPDVNQDGDGWKTQYRKYHDLWIMDNKLEQIIVSLRG